MPSLAVISPAFEGDDEHALRRVCHSSTMPALGV
jgi:hypothetical protein